MEPKPRIKSRTHWAGGVITVLGVIIQNAEVFAPMFGEYGGAVMAGLGGLMMVLREITKGPVGKPNPNAIK